MTSIGAAATTSCEDPVGAEMVGIVEAPGGCVILTRCSTDTSSSSETSNAGSATSDALPAFFDSRTNLDLLNTVFLSGARRCFFTDGAAVSVDTDGAATSVAFVAITWSASAVVWCTTGTGAVAALVAVAAVPRGYHSAGHMIASAAVSGGGACTAAVAAAAAAAAATSATAWATDAGAAVFRATSNSSQTSWTPLMHIVSGLPEAIATLAARLGIELGQDFWVVTDCALVMGAICGGGGAVFTLFSDNFGNRVDPCM